MSTKESLVIEEIENLNILLSDDMNRLTARATTASRIGLNSSARRIMDAVDRINEARNFAKTAVEQLQKGVS